MPCEALLTQTLFGTSFKGPFSLFFVLFLHFLQANVSCDSSYKVKADYSNVARLKDGVIQYVKLANEMFCINNPE